MGDLLRTAILDAAGSDPEGVAMGVIVDTVAGRGFRVEDVEAALWSLLRERRLTPSGFVCRRLRGGAPERARSALPGALGDRLSGAGAAGAAGAAGVARADPVGPAIYRAYEFLLTPWSPELDQQLDLGLDRGPAGGRPVRG